MTTALTAYFNVAGTGNPSSTLSTADVMVTTLDAGTNNTNKNSLIGTSTGWGEIYSQGNAGAWAAAGSIGSPSGHGFLWDVTTLETNQISTGNWSSIVHLNLSAGSIVATLHVRAYQRSSGGTYTLIADMVVTGQTISTSAADFTCTVNSVAASNTFATGDKLYVDIWANITSNSTGSGAATLKLNACSTANKGNATAEVVTPGYSVPPSSQTQNGASRFKLSGSVLKNGIVRFIQRGSTTRNGASRFRQSVSKALNGASRLKLSGSKPLNGASRFKLSGSSKKDGSARFKLGINKNGVIRFVQANPVLKNSITRFRMSNLSSRDGYVRFIQLATVYRNGITRFKQVSAQMRRDGLVRFALRQVTSVTVYMTTNASAIIGGNTLASSGNSTQNVTNKNSLIGTAIGYGEIVSGGTSQNWYGGSVTPLPSGNGYEWDVTNLEGNAFQPGAWSAGLRLAVSSGSITADLHVRAWKRSSAGVYTSIIDIVSTNKTINTSFSVFTITGSTSGASPVFNLGEKLYIDVIANILSNSTNSGTATIKTMASTSSTTGNTEANVVTSGYTSPVSVVKSAITRFKVYASKLKDARVRIRVAASRLKDGANRLRLSAKQTKDGASRFKQRTATINRDGINRFKISSVTQYKNAIVRIKTQGQRYRDGINRFRLSSNSIRNGMTRLLLSGAPKRDGQTRFIQHSTTLYKDGLTLFRLRLLTQKDAVIRFLQVSSKQYYNAQVRFNQYTVKTDNASTRFKIRSITQYRDGITRFKQYVPKKVDAGTRLKTQGPVYAGGTNRFRLNTPTRYRDASSRFKQSISVKQNYVTRFRQSVTRIKDGATRFLLISPTIYRTATTRFRQSIPRLKNGITRFRQSVPVLGDANTRFLQSANQTLNSSTRLRTSSRMLRNGSMRLLIQLQKNAIIRFRLSTPKISSWSTRLRTCGPLSLSFSILLRQHVNVIRSATARLRLSKVASRNAACRLQTYHFNPRDGRIRFALHPSTVSPISSATTEIVFRDGTVEMVFRS